MKIFLICNSLGCGGAERVHVNLANGFAQRNNEVFLIADIFQPATYPVAENVKVMPLCSRSSNKLVKWLKALRMVRKYIKDNKPDVVIGNMFLCSMLSRVAVIGTKIPVVMTIHHALESKEYELGKIEKFVDCHTSFLYSATTVLTIPDRNLLAVHYRQKKNIYVMPNPLTYLPVTVDSDGLMRNESSEILNKEKVILAAGRLDGWKVKGWDLLMQVAGKIKPLLLHEGWKIMIAGGGTEETKDMLLNMRFKVGAEEVVELLGYRTDMKNLYQKASIFLLSSRSEGLPMVLIEAMSQGCAPVACENLGRTCEIITNDSEGLLFETANVDDMAEKLTCMILNQKYMNLVQKHSVERSKYYSIEKTIERWEMLLDSIVMRK